MQIGQSLTNWITTLAEIAAEWRLARQSRKSVTVTRSAGGLTFRWRDGKGEAKLIELPAGAPLSSEATEALRDRPVLFEAAADHIVTRRISVPQQAQDFLPGIVRNQIERLSPWPLAQAIYGFDATPKAGDPHMLDVRVLIAARATITGICEQLKACGLVPDRIIAAAEAGNKAAGPVTLWTGASLETDGPAQRVRKMIAAGLVALPLASLAVSAWALHAASATSKLDDETTLQIADIEQQERQSRTPAALTSHDPAERAWALKENSPTAFLTLEALARALPDSAYLNELHLENTDDLRIIGLAADAPSLIAALEHSKQFSSVHFFAPTTKDPSGRYRFYIEAKVDHRFIPVGD